MRIYKPTYLDRKGLQREGKNWAAEWRFRDRLCRCTLFSDRKASEEAARNIDRLANLCDAHDVPDAPLNRWLENVPSRIRAYLAKVGVIDGRRLAAGKLLSDHLDDFEAYLTAKGGTLAHAKLTVTRVRTVFEGSGMRTWSEVTAFKCQQFLTSRRADTLNKKNEIVKRGISPQTFNYYLQSVKQFCKWMVRDGRASESPLLHLDALNTRTDRRHDRRALSVDEVRRLLVATEAAGIRGGMSGTERALLYRLAVESGLRANEIRSLTCSSFRLAGKNPSVAVRAAYSKRRRDDTQPIPQTTAEALRAFLATKMPAAKAFNLPTASKIAPMLKRDLAAAKAAWVKEAPTPLERDERGRSDFLAYRDSAGRVADFHALRHTYITNLASAGVHPKTAQSLARHSTITLTMDRYSHSNQGDEAKALNSLPDLAPAAAIRLAATGTDGPPPAEGLNERAWRAWRAAWRFGSDSVKGLAGADGLTAEPSRCQQIAIFAVKSQICAGFTGLKSTRAGVAELADATDSKSVAL